MIKNLPYELRDLEIHMQKLLVRMNAVEAQLKGGGDSTLQEEINSLKEQIKFLEEELEVNKVPVGTIVSCGVDTNYIDRVPKGFLRCKGEEVSRSEFPELFEAIGVSFGNGDGATTFNLPNFVGLVPRGAGSQQIDGRWKEAGPVGSVLEDQMQRMTGQFGRVINTSANGTGVFTLTANQGSIDGYRTPVQGVVNNSRSGIFDSAGSPNARTSDTTEGETRVSSLSVDFIIKAK